MKRWLRWTIWLYPAAWRARYVREFDALLDDLRPGWRDLWDTFRGAILMQLSTPAVYLKVGAVTAVIGALVAPPGVSTIFFALAVLSGLTSQGLSSFHAPLGRSLTAYGPGLERGCVWGL